MTRIRITGACLASALVLGAIAAAGASAMLPEIGRCVAQVGGKYTNSNCMKTGKPGAFEFEKNAIKKGFTMASVGEVALENGSGEEITCLSQSGAGEYLEKGTKPSTKEVHHVVLALKGCHIPLFNASCQNTANEGEIVTTKLKGAIKYVSGKGTESPVVGQLLAPEVKKEGFARFKCPVVGIEVFLQGSVIGTYAKVNKMSLTNTLTFEGSGGAQSPQHFEGESTIHNLEGLPGKAGREKTALLLTTTITNEEELELKA